MKMFPGMVLAVFVALAARLLSVCIPAVGEVCLAILLGMIPGNLMRRGGVFEAGLGFAGKVVLPVAIALMGTELELNTLGALGVRSLLVVIGPMGLAIAASLLFGRMLGFPKRVALVLGIGNSVCGSSAVLAAAPALAVKKHDVAVAVAAVNLMGMIGMFVLPVLAALFAFPAEKTSYLIGGSLQAVGQVVSAGFSVSDAVGHDALVIKMLRVIMIGPIVMLLHLILGHREPKPVGFRRFPVPAYIIGFVVCAGAASLFPQDTHVLPIAKFLAKALLLIAMAALGFSIRLRSLFTQGPKAILMVALLSILQTGGVLLALCFAGV